MLKKEYQNAFLFLFIISLFIISSYSISALSYSPRNSAEFISDEEKSGCSFSGFRAICGSCKSMYQLDCAYYFYEKPSDCLDLGNNRNSCVPMIHILSNLKNSEIKNTCSYMDGTDSVKYNCITSLLYRNLESIGDTKYCKDISDFRRDGCLKHVILNQSTSKGEAQYCMDISDDFSHIRTDCYREMALKFNDAKTCGSIDTSTLRILDCCLEVKYPRIHEEYKKVGFNPEETFLFYDRNAREIEDCKAITDLAGPEVVTFCEKLNCDCTKPLNKLSETDMELAREIAVECVLERGKCYMEHRTISDPELDSAVSVQGLGGWNRRHCHAMFDFPSLDGFIDWDKWKSWTYTPEPKYPLYDPFFDYDGDGMLNEYEYADYLKSQIIVAQTFNEFYDDSEKIEYMDAYKDIRVNENELPDEIIEQLEESVIEGGEISENINPDVITRFDLPNLFSQVNTYEQALLQMSDAITYEVSTIAEEIDRTAKTIVRMETSLKDHQDLIGNIDVDERLKQLREREKSLEGTYFRKGTLEGVREEIAKLEGNLDIIRKLQERIETARNTIENQTARQVELINRIDEEYRVLISKYDEDLKKADSDFTAIPMRDLRRELVENAQYAKVTAYFHSGQTKEFERLANRLKITNRDHGAEIAILLGLKKLEKGDPQSALHDFKEAMAIDPNNAAAREITNKIESNYLSRIEERLMNELEGDRKRYEASTTAGGPGAFNVMRDILTTGIASSTGALFGYEEAKAIESGLLQTDASKQVAGIKVARALMSDGMTLKELYELRRPEDIQKLAQSRGRDLTIEQARRYRELINSALNNPDIDRLKQNSYYPLQVDSHQSYFNTNYNPGLTAQLLDSINVKNVIMTLGPNAVVSATKAGKAITAKEYVRGLTGIDKFQRALLSGKVGAQSGRAGQIFAATSARLGRDFKTMSNYGFIRKTAIKQGFSYIEGKTVDGIAEAVLGKDNAAIFSDLYKGVAAFTGFNDLGDMMDIAGNMEWREFETDFRQSLREDLIDHQTLAAGKNAMDKKAQLAQRANEINTDSVQRKIETSINSKKSLTVEEIAELKKEMLRQSEELMSNPDVLKSKAGFLKQTEIDAMNHAIMAYEDGNLDVVTRQMQKAQNMQRLFDKEVTEIAVHKELAKVMFENAENLRVDEKVTTVTDLIKVGPMPVGNLNIPDQTIIVDGAQKTIGGNLDVFLEYGTADEGWQSIIRGDENSASFKIAKSIGFFDVVYDTAYNEDVAKELESLALKTIEKIVDESVKPSEKAWDRLTQEYALSVDLPNSNRIIVKVNEVESEEDKNKRAVVNNAIVMRDEIYQNHIKDGRYIVIK